MKHYSALFCLFLCFGLVPSFCFAEDLIFDLKGKTQGGALCEFTIYIDKSESKMIVLSDSTGTDIEVMGTNAYSGKIKGSGFQGGKQLAIFQRDGFKCVGVDNAYPFVLEIDDKKKTFTGYNTWMNIFYSGVIE